MKATASGVRDGHVHHRAHVRDNIHDPYIHHDALRRDLRVLVQPQQRKVQPEGAREISASKKSFRLLTTKLIYLL
jgi:hypothetical protein